MAKFRSFPPSIDDTLQEFKLVRLGGLIDVNKYLRECIEQTGTGTEGSGLDSSGEHGWINYYH